jgi:hypothetical protein
MTDNAINLQREKQALKSDMSQPKHSGCGDSFCSRNDETKSRNQA